MNNKSILLAVGLIAIAALAAAEAPQRHNDHSSAERVQDLEALVQRDPASQGSAAARVELGYEYRQAGRFSRALDHWLAAWDLCKNASDGAAKETADHALVQSTYLLAGLGRLETLEGLIKANLGRTISRFDLAQRWAKTREAAAHMKRRPWISYKCGVYALENAARALNGISEGAVAEKASPTNGFTLAELSKLSEDFNLGFVPAFRTGQTEVAVPSVVHWKQNHYAAIVKRKDGKYLLSTRLRSAQRGSQKKRFSRRRAVTF